MSLTKTNKIILSSFEDKQYYVNALKSYGYRHHKITNMDINNNKNNNANSNRADEECKKVTDRKKRERYSEEETHVPLEKKKRGKIYILIYINK